MKTALPIAKGRNGRANGVLLLAGIILASLTEAVASTVLSLGRSDIIGDIYATPDEFAWLDVGYTSLKLMAFIAAPWLFGRVDPGRLVAGSTLVMGAACALAAATARLDALIALRAIQGLAGGILLVGGQTLIFVAWPRRLQPVLQALFAMGAVAAPATIAPALQGWLLDNRSWTWIFLCVVPVALAAAGLLLMADVPTPERAARRPFDWIGFLLVSASLTCFAYVLIQGSRWNWFDEPRITWLTLVGAISLMAFLGRQMGGGSPGLLNVAVFRSADFAFAFIVSFVAGAALFGSAYLIPSFAISVLAFTPTDAGLLLLPSGVLFVVSLLVCAFLMQACRVPPIATVPFGVGMIMVAMWMLSGSTGESGAGDMMSAILLRGFSLGFLFLSITLIAFDRLESGNLASGIGLFNAGRQLGGLIGVAALQTLIQDNVAANATVLQAHVATGSSELGGRLQAMAAALVAKGMDAMEANQAAIALLDRAVAGQSRVIAFDTAFNAIALLFVTAAPVLITIKIVLARTAVARA